MRIVVILERSFTLRDYSEQIIEIVRDDYMLTIADGTRACSVAWGIVDKRFQPLVRPDREGYTMVWRPTSPVRPAVRSDLQCHVERLIS